MTAQIGKTVITFKVNTGTDLTVIPASKVRERTMGSLTNANEILRDAGLNAITTKGRFQATIFWKRKSARQTFL